MSCMIQFRETFWLSRNNQLKNDRILNALAADIELFFHLFSLDISFKKNLGQTEKLQTKFLLWKEMS